MLKVRPARLDDLDAFLGLADLSGPGFTSLPVDRDRLAETIETSVASFSHADPDPAGANYLMMLEDDTGDVLGCVGVKAKVGLKKPFFNFKILGMSQASAAAQRRFDMDVLMLVNEYSGCTEVGTLFVHPKLRGAGAGWLLAKTRYLLIAAAPERFADVVIAELRGVSDDEGHSPFWEHLGAKFFAMSFPEADYLSATTDNQFILDLMPKYPIYLELLAQEARAVVGQVHDAGRAAMAMLEAEGFRYDRVVDIFDGGPLVCASRESIRTIQEAKLVTVDCAGDAVDDGVDAIVTPADFDRFVAGRAPVCLADDVAVMARHEMDRLGLEPGDHARIWVKS